jgi:deoxyribodipyrimidine photo-lyase
MKTVIYWFRNDLRLHDQPVLSAIESQRLLPVYVIDPRELKPNKYLGFAKMGARRAHFLLESLLDLKKSLKSLSSDLLVLVGEPVETLSHLAQSLKADCIFAQAANSYQEIKDEQALSKKVKLNLHHSQTLLHAKHLRQPIERFAEVFTQFRNQVEPLGERTPVQESAEIPMSLPPLADCEIPELPDLGYPKPEKEPRSVLEFKGGETAALQRLDQYIWQRKSLAHYKLTRNEMLGSEYSSKFSPFLALGCLSPRKIYQEVMDFEEKVEKNESTYWLIFELLWRDFFHFTSLKHGRKMFLASGLKDSSYRFKDDKASFWAWANGETGEDFIDANMLELKHTGFMSNRGRQNVASYFCKDLKLDWRWGAAYFEHALLDYDPCSNWGNWLYVAGLGNDPRQDRYFNIKTQQQQYDPLGKYRANWLKMR